MLKWPAHDKHCRPVIEREVQGIEQSLHHVEGRAIAVQAGGNVGAMPLMLSRHFGRVITFEPEPENWTCLTENTAVDGSIEPWNAGLSDTDAGAGLKAASGNAGAHQLIPGGSGIRTMTIDSLDLPLCDLIQLDIEGMEALAVAGASRTIAEHRPVVILEMKGHGETYGWPDQRLRNHMMALGYRDAEHIGRDVVWLPD